jgi:hypothetical protein
MGMVLGTPAYMSPEQCEGKGAIDHRSDIYSLGVMLYEMLTGTLPFEGDLGEVMLAQMVSAPPPPRQRNPAIPPEWEALCLRMMEKQRENRFQSVTDLAHALDDLEGHAQAYDAFRTDRARGNAPGHTMIAPAEGRGLTSDGRVIDGMGETNDSRATVHGSLEQFTARGGPGTPPAQPAPVPVPPYQAPMPRPDPLEPCAVLVSDPRYAGFARTLMVRPGGRWYDVFEVCRTGSVAPPPTLPGDLSLFVTWVEHPYQDPSLAAVVFLSLRTGWSTVVLCPRARW